jgi:hypothetical protein
MLDGLSAAVVWDMPVLGGMLLGPRRGVVLLSCLPPSVPVCMQAGEIGLAMKRSCCAAAALLG